MASGPQWRGEMLRRVVETNDELRLVAKAFRRPRPRVPRDAFDEWRRDLPGPVEGDLAALEEIERRVGRSIQRLSQIREAVALQAAALRRKA